MTETALLLALAFGFAVSNGVNDGATLVATGLKVRALTPLSTIVLLGLALAFGPLLFGTAVAATLTNQLVATDGGAARTVAIAVVVAMLVVAGSTRLGLPTSLTLALVGALAGAGLGLGQPVSWATVALVLGVALLAPVAGGILGWAISLAAGRLRTGDAGRTVRVSHRFAYGAQCCAYAANDGQKMFAVAAVALGAASDAEVALPLPAYLGLAACFTVGVLLGLPRVAPTLNGAVLAVRPPNAVAAELAAASSAFASAATGAPVSMTQTVTGGLIGSGLSESYHKVRWRGAASLGLAWVVTLPAAVGGAWATAAAVGALAS